MTPLFGKVSVAYGVLLSTRVLIRSFSIWETEWCDHENSPHTDILQDIAREDIIESINAGRCTAAML